MRSARSWSRVLAMSLVPCLAYSQQPIPDLPSDIPSKWQTRTDTFDFERREALIPMRDGAKLFTVILVPKGIERAPILLERTPYGASDGSSYAHSSRLEAVLHNGDDVVSHSGYIRVIQDVRGKYKSEGSYVMNRPLRGPLNASRTDHATDTWDTIEWLVHNVPENNGRVGMIGTSYDGFTVLMGLFDSHPALKVAVAIAPMVDPWRGDDWFHNGTFRQVYAADYAYEQTATQKSEEKPWRSQYDEYQTFLDSGSADDFAKQAGVDQLPFWQRLVQHPAYDSYWQEQAVDRLLAAHPPTVPVMLVHGLWDQEDIYGAPAVYRALKPKEGPARDVYLVIGPWRHGGSNGDGSSLGEIRFSGDTAYEFRRHILQPFLDRYLKEAAPAVPMSPVTAYETGSDRWRSYDVWPRSCAAGCPNHSAPLYFAAGGTLSFVKPAGSAAFQEYVSDPAKPVPYRQRPMRPVYWDGSTWRQWLVDDQRNAAARPDVLVYRSAVLTSPVRIAGDPVVHLTASTTGSDSDWVVKLIDEYPAEVPHREELGGYQLMVAADVFRGRYRESFEHPSALTPNKALSYSFALPTSNHVFRPGHRIMVQVQSSWFPLYDRNPQTFVPNIFLARPADYRKATQRVFSGGAEPSFIDLPTVPWDGASDDFPLH